MCKPPAAKSLSSNSYLLKLPSLALLSISHLATCFKASWGFGVCAKMPCGSHNNDSCHIIMLNVSECQSPCSLNNSTLWFSDICVEKTCHRAAALKGPHVYISAFPSKHSQWVARSRLDSYLQVCRRERAWFYMYAATVKTEMNLAFLHLDPNTKILKSGSNLHIRRLKTHGIFGTELKKGPLLVVCTLIPLLPLGNKFSRFLYSLKKSV